MLPCSSIFDFFCLEPWIDCEDLLSFSVWFSIYLLIDSYLENFDGCWETGLRVLIRLNFLLVSVSDFFEELLILGMKVFLAEILSPFELSSLSPNESSDYSSLATFVLFLLLFAEVNDFDYLYMPFVFAGFFL
jgi:hypothetical protein